MIQKNIFTKITPYKKEIPPIFIDPKKVGKSSFSISGDKVLAQSHKEVQEQTAANASEGEEVKVRAYQQ